MVFNHGIFIAKVMNNGIELKREARELKLSPDKAELAVRRGRKATGQITSPTPCEV